MVINKTIMTLLDILVGVIVIACLWYGLSDNIIPYLKNLKSKRKRINLNEDKRRNKNFVTRLLTFNAVTGMDAESTVVFCVIVFVVSLICVSIFATVNILTIIISLMLGVLPMVVKRIRLEELRLKGSFDGEKIVTLLLNSYHTNNKDMGLAIDSVAIKIDNPYSRKVFTQLAIDIKSANTAERTTEVLEQMHYAYNTNWSAVLVHAIFSAVWEGDDVTTELNKVITMFKRVNELNEGTKRYNNEAFMILRIFIPVCYLIIMWYGGKLYGKTLMEMLRANFEIPAAIQLFIATVIVYIVCMVFGRILKLGKYDL